MRRSVRRRRQAELQRNTFLAAAGAVVVTLVLIALGPKAPTPAGELPSVVVPERHARPYANGKALGKADAPVVIDEFSDFG